MVKCDRHTVAVEVIIESQCGQSNLPLSVTSIIEEVALFRSRTYEGRKFNSLGSDSVVLSHAWEGLPVDRLQSDGGL